MPRINIKSDTIWEDIVGYSRVVRIGNVVEVTGTVASREGAVVGKENPYEQTMFIFSKIEEYIQQAGASMSDVARTRIYVTNIEHWEEVGRAHAEYFKEIGPATSLVEVSALIGPDYLVEIEATAYIEE